MPTDETERRGAPSSTENVFVVVTPLQLLNALEAKAVHATERNLLVFLNSRPYASQLAALLDPADWDRVVRLQDPRGGDVRASRWVRYLELMRVRRRLDALVRRIGRVDGVFLGNFSDIAARHLAATLPHTTLHLLDDGMATVAYANSRAETHGERRPHRRLRRTWRDRLMGFKRHEPMSVTFFTTFDLDVGRHDLVISNTYDHLRASLPPITIASETWFLGQPLVEDDLMNEATYVRYIDAIRRDCGGGAFVYSPHARESRDRIARMRERLGVEVRESRLPIEAELSRSGGLPRVLASFCSSALDTCRIIFRDETMLIRSYELAAEDLAEGHQAVYLPMYEFLRSRQSDTFRVVALGREELVA